MSDYTHRMTLAVPQALIPQANQLALIVGESEEDDKTFTQANWQDEDGDLYAVCSTVIKPIVLSLLTTSLTDSVLTSETANIVMAQQAMDLLDVYVEGAKASPNKISIAIDIEPLEFFEAIGLTMVEVDIDTPTNA